MLETYDRAFKLLDAYRSDVDLIFLDIQVPDMMGIDAARRIRDVDQEVMIIFVTNLTQYAIDGYSVRAFDYILKPLNYFSFSKKLRRALRMLSYRSNELHLDIKTKEGGRRLAEDAIGGPLCAVQRQLSGQSEICTGDTPGSGAGWGGTA